MGITKRICFSDVCGILLNTWRCKGKGRSNSMYFCIYTCQCLTPTVWSQWSCLTWRKRLPATFWICLQKCWSMMCLCGGWPISRSHCEQNPWFWLDCRMIALTSCWRWQALELLQRQQLLIPVKHFSTLVAMVAILWRRSCCPRVWLRKQVTHMDRIIGSLQLELLHWWLSRW